MTRDWTTTDAADAADDKCAREWWKGDPFPACRDTDETYCPRCGEPDPDPSVEAFEVFGEAMCAECAADMFSDDGQPDEDQEWADFDKDC